VKGLCWFSDLSMCGWQCKAAH